MTTANRRHQGHPVSEATIQSVYRDRLLWGLDELGPTAAMVRGIVDEVEQYGDDRTKEVARHVYALCIDVIDEVSKYRKELE